MANRAIRHLLAERLGLEFPGSRDQDLRTALEAARAFLSLDGLPRLYECLEDQEPDSPAWQLLRERLTVGETYFFRDPAQLQEIQEYILRPLVERGQPRRLRLWSAGCASGEEAYSLAALALEVVPPGLGWQVDILGTDLDPSALRKAQAASYKDWSFRGVTTDLRERWFEKARNGWSVRPEIRQLVRFSAHNLATDPFEPLSAGDGFDLILCRNVLIYFQDATRVEILDRFRQALRPGGALVTGHNEIEPVAAIALGAQHLRGTLIIRRPASPAAVPIPPPPAPPAPALAPRVVPAPARPAQPAPARSPLDSARQALASGDHNRALELAKAVRGAEAIQVAGQALANLGRGQEATALVVAGLSRHPMDARLHYLHSLLASDQGADGEAMRALDRTLYLARDHVAALMDRARAFQVQGRLREALKDLEQALASLQGRADLEPVDGLEPHRVGEVRPRCQELLEQVRRRAHG
jgi:chemotaxis protein methyltransferase CheR